MTLWNIFCIMCTNFCGTYIINCGVISPDTAALLFFNYFTNFSASSCVTIISSSSLFLWFLLGCKDFVYFLLDVCCIWFPSRWEKCGLFVNFPCSLFLILSILFRILNFSYLQYIGRFVDRFFSLFLFFSSII